MLLVSPHLRLIFVIGSLGLANLFLLGLQVPYFVAYVRMNDNWQADVDVRAGEFDDNQEVKFEADDRIVELDENREVKFEVDDRVVELDENREVEFARTFLGNCSFPRPENERLCSDLCYEFTPECLERKDLQKIWGWVPNMPHKSQRYSRSVCCRYHGMGRIVGTQVLSVLQDMNLTYWVGDGTLIGMERHNGTMIPWDDDLDFRVLMHRKESDKEYLFGLPSVHYHEFGEVAEAVVERLNHFWTSNSLVHYTASPLTNYTVKLENGKDTLTFPGTATSQIKTMFRRREINSGKKDFCHQHHAGLILQHHVNGTRVESFKFTTDLWGYMPDLKQPIREVMHQNTSLQMPSIRTGGCWTSKFGLNDTYMVLPPVPCNAHFYGNPEIPLLCPRDAIGHLKAHYGDNVLEQAQSYKQTIAKKKITNTTT